MWALVSQLEAIHAHAEGIEHSSTQESADEHEEGEHSDEENHDESK